MTDPTSGYDACKISNPIENQIFSAAKRALFPTRRTIMGSALLADGSGANRDRWSDTLDLEARRGVWALGKLRSMEELFAGRHFDREVIILCVRWYLRYKLSFRDLVEMMAERGLDLAHTTVDAL